MTYTIIFNCLPNKVTCSQFVQKVITIHVCPCNYIATKINIFGKQSISICPAYFIAVYFKKAFPKLLQVCVAYYFKRVDDYQN